MRVFISYCLKLTVQPTAIKISGEHIGEAVRDPSHIITSINLIRPARGVAPNFQKPEQYKQDTQGQVINGQIS